MKYGLLALLCLALIPGCGTSNKKAPVTKKHTSKSKTTKPNRRMPRERAQERQEMMEMEDMDMMNEQI